MVEISDIFCIGRAPAVRNVASFKYALLVLSFSNSHNAQGDIWYSIVVIQSRFGTELDRLSSPVRATPGDRNAHDQ